jgi:hypothetical protein
MKLFVRNAFLGAAGLVAASLPAHATSSIAIQDSPLLNSAATAPLKMVQRNENPGGAGFRNENPGGAGFRNENPGGAGMKKAKKSKKKKVAG